MSGGGWFGYGGAGSVGKDYIVPIATAAASALKSVDYYGRTVPQRWLWENSGTIARVGGEVATEWAANEAERYAGNWGRSAVRGLPGWVPGVTVAFAKGLGWRAKNLVRKFGRRGIGMDFQPSRRPYVPQKRYPRQFVRRSHRNDRFRSGSRSVFFERPGDWKNQFRGVGKF